MSKKIALIGLSGVGKSECLKLIDSPDKADMDEHLDTSVIQSADNMLKWIVESLYQFVTVSVHQCGLEEMVNLKKQEPMNSFFTKIRFVYLFCGTNELEKRLLIPGSGRRKENIEGTLQKYDYLDSLMKNIMDECIDTTSYTVSEVAGRVKAIFQSGKEEARENKKGLWK